MGYEIRNNFVKDENFGLLACSNNILDRWKSCFSLLLYVHNVSGVKLIEIHTTKPPVPGPRHLEGEIAIAKLQKYKSPRSDQIPAEVIQTGYERLGYVIHKLINSISDQWKNIIIVPIHKKGNKTDCNNYRGMSLLATSYNTIQYSSSTVKFINT
jgi:hypothetical protein